MDHLVLIPKDFNLVVKTDKLSQDDVSVWSNRHISQGTIYYPFQGTVRFDRLNVFSLINEEDVSVVHHIIYSMRKFHLTVDDRQPTLV
jgi:hypothetical protein